jgi:hypothetical protein
MSEGTTSSREERGVIVTVSLTTTPSSRWDHAHPGGREGCVPNPVESIARSPEDIAGLSTVPQRDSDSRCRAARPANRSTQGVPAASAREPVSRWCAVSSSHPCTPPMCSRGSAAPDAPVIVRSARRDAVPPVDPAWSTVVTLRWLATGERPRRRLLFSLPCALARTSCVLPLACGSEAFYEQRLAHLLVEHHRPFQARRFAGP